ncbi:hypothetical protein BHM03_00036854 [Ensete ventricosum]|nr:hypothetical protein BHM03_00036854 [Ensete ventricosum]
MTPPWMESPVAPNREDQPEVEVHNAGLWKFTRIPWLLYPLGHGATLAIWLKLVQKEFLKSKGEFGESSKGGSLFTPEIQDKPLPANFRLPSLELCDDSCDPAKYVTTFYTQMALYDTSDALMC